MIAERELAGVKEYLYFRDVKDEIYEYLAGTRELVKAETTRWTPFDEHFRWLRTEITGFGGIPSHGKSKFVIFLSALKMLHDGYKVAIYSPETSPSVFLFTNYLHTLTGSGLFGHHKPTRQEVARFEALLENQLFLCEPEKMPTFKGIMARFEKAYEYHGADMFIIDPFNCLEREWELSKRDDRYVGEFLDYYKAFAKKTNTCGVVVAHPKSTVRQKKDGLGYDCPNAYDLAGGAMWYNKLDNLCFVHRPNMVEDAHDSTVLARWAKIKKKEIVGMGGDVYMDFNFKTNRYSYRGIEPGFNEQQTKINHNEPPF